MHAYFMYTVGKTLIQTNLSFSRYTMSKIDLDRLIVRQTYFIPTASSQLEETIANELNASYQALDGLLLWGVVEKHGLSFHFKYDLKFAFIYDETWGLNRTTPEGKKLVKQKSEEFDNMGKEGFFKKLETIRTDVPCHLCISVVTQQKNGCLCNVDCWSTLYEKLRYNIVSEASDFQIQNAYLQTKRFLELTFKSGLSASLVTEEKKIPPQPVTQFLVNDQTSHHILDKINAMLDQATGEVLICGWVGTILLPKLKVVKQKGINIRIMTHKSIELKGKQGKQDVERAHSELISLLGKENISMSPECHFRVLVVDNKALVGSMDFNAISLTGTHREFAIYTEDPEIVRSIRKYFNQIFTPLKE